MHPLAFPIGPVELIILMVLLLPIAGVIVLVVVLNRGSRNRAKVPPSPPSARGGFSGQPHRPPHTQPGGHSPSGSQSGSSIDPRRGQPPMPPGPAG